MRILATFLMSLMLATPVAAQIREGDYLYKVTTIRAAPGHLEPLLNHIAEIKSSDYFEQSGEHPPFVMRHTQGDQWDLLLVEPMESWSKYHSRSVSKKRKKARDAYKEASTKEAPLIAFQEDHFAYGPPLSEFIREYGENGFYHIEMFKAAPGKAKALFEQRQMENEYLATTGQTTNMIFKRAAGSDVDVFTIGFHEDFQAFAAPSGATPEEAEAAAIAAGFENRADISFYLRKLLSSHHDTLAIKVE